MSAWKVSRVSTIRFPGSLNVDLNEISMNLVPFPRYDVQCCICRLTRWGQSSLLSRCNVAFGGSPEHRADVCRGLSPEQSAHVGIVPQRFAAAAHAPLQADITSSRMLASALLVRGAVSMAEANSSIDKLQRSVDLIHWNTHGFKLGLCSVPPVRDHQQPAATLCQ